MFIYLVGWVLITAALLYFTLRYAALHFYSVGLAGWHSLREGWVWSIFGLIVIAVAWWAWWEYVAATINFSISVN